MSSWVRSSRAEMDHALWSAVIDWLREVWPFRSVRYAERPGRRTVDSPEPTLETVDDYLQPEPVSIEGHLDEMDTVVERESVGV